MLVTIQDRLLAVMGGAGALAGMFGVVHFSGTSLAPVIPATPDTPPSSSAMGRQSSQSDLRVKNVEITPCLSQEFSGPLEMAGAFAAAVLIKAAFYPEARPISELLGVDKNIVFGAGAVLYAAAALLRYKSVQYMVDIGKQTDTGFELKTLCTRGPYGLFRHPVYVGVFGCTLAAPLVLDSAYTCIAPVAYGIYAWGMVIPSEEKAMRDKFTAEYSAYCNTSTLGFIYETISRIMRG
mmetsp:Transcript_67395/g.140441  ORF Transcript_67395/g.140441 Transcript_67395/m.140441 type:complete len:237 (-) Transcript_67395:444-1154(-)|eukprot:CAMPEP_0181330360 /NCGR_PEP_ID=MMETSP1101-20121128/23856_1 /TAXON_ID=46948 /ORGANISM="Rhodomonas abbreviata, Strain Caron Lab Isolate" /LENGTH=236 /DNA_ID=CAMNT_0023439607 /DNA_START=171 /DNA_END=881 /DNA_ORIENTATION=-